MGRAAPGFAGPVANVAGCGSPVSDARPQRAPGSERTAAMTRARARRASYLSTDRLAGFNDPGVEGVARLFEHLAAA